MMQSTHQTAETIINGDKIYIFLGNDKNERLLIKKQTMWAEGLGISYHHFSYKNEAISIIGRENEKKKIKININIYSDYGRIHISGSGDAGSHYLAAARGI